MSQNIPIRFKAEKSDKAMALRRHICDLQINLVLSFSEQLDQVRLSKAVRLTFDAEPILGCKYQESWLQPFWLRRKDLDQIGCCQVVSPTDLDQALVDFLCAPLDVEESPLIQVAIFRTEQDTLCIKANHLVTDAGGLKRYVNLLANIYRKLAANDNYTVEVTSNGCRSSQQVLNQFDFLSKLKMIRRGYRNWKSDISPPKNWSFPLLESSPSKKMFVIKTIKQNMFKILSEYRQKFGVTINDIMVTAFYRALYKIIQPDKDVPLRLCTTVNLRRYLPRGEEEAICNLAGLVQLNIGASLGKGFEETLFRVNQTMKELKDDYLGLGMNRFDIFNYRFLPNSFAKWVCHQITKINSMIAPQQVPPYLTNMGVIEKEQLDFGNREVTKAYLTAPLAYPPMFIIGLSGFNNTITMSIGFCESNAEKETVQKLVDYVEEELDALTSYFVAGNSR